MSCCEKCWGEAYSRMFSYGGEKSQSEFYREILKEKELAGKKCTQREQDGGWFEEREKERLRLSEELE